MCADCLEHVDDPARVVGEIARVLKDGGTFCYDTLNRNLLSRTVVGWIVDPILRREYRNLNVSERDFAVHDWRRFIRPEELTALMNRHGLAHRETRGIRFAGFKRGGFKTEVGGKPTLAYIGCSTRQR